MNGSGIFTKTTINCIEIVKSLISSHWTVASSKPKSLALWVIFHVMVKKQIHSQVLEHLSYSVLDVSTCCLAFLRKNKKWHSTFWFFISTACIFVFVFYWEVCIVKAKIQDTATFLALLFCAGYYHSPLIQRLWLLLETQIFHFSNHSPKRTFPQPTGCRLGIISYVMQ